MPKVLPIMLICIYTMCQNTSSEPASEQTLIFTHRYGINVFSSSVLILLSIVFTGMHAGVFWRRDAVITHVCNYSCVVKNCVNARDYSGNTDLCMHKLMYEPT